MGTGYGRSWKDGRNKMHSHMVWNEHHPDSPVQPGEVVHHKDGDVKNDAVGNLQKMTRAEHNKLHHTGRIEDARHKEKRLHGVKKYWSKKSNRERRSREASERWKDPVFVGRQKRGVRHVAGDPEWRERLSKGQKAAWKDGEIRAKRLAGQRKTLSTNAEKRRKSAVMKNRYSDPEE